MSRRGRPPLGQHFLHDSRIAARIAQAAAVEPGTDVLEIGPGEGALTVHLLDRGGRVTGIEIDPDLAAALAERWGGESRFRLVVGDVLETPFPDPEGRAWTIVGNLPYESATPILFHALEQADRVPIDRLVVMVQREVADRLVAEPGSKRYGALTVGVRLAADAERLFDVGPGAFRPPPQVTSSVVRIELHDGWGLDPDRRERVRRLVRRAFLHRRKQLGTSLRTGRRGLDREVVDRLERATGIDLVRRPETLSVEEWIRLADALDGPSVG